MAPRALSHPSIWEPSQKLFEGLFSRSVSGLDRLIKDRRTCYRGLSAGSINFPSPRFWRWRAVLNNDGKVGLIGKATDGFQYEPAPSRLASGGPAVVIVVARQLRPPRQYARVHGRGPRTAGRHFGALILPPSGTSDPTDIFDQSDRDYWRATCRPLV
jgi:hypothetical protein